MFSRSPDDGAAIKYLGVFSLCKNTLERGVLFCVAERASDAS